MTLPCLMSRNLNRIATLPTKDPVFDTGLAVPSDVPGEDSETEGGSPEGKMRLGGPGKASIPAISSGGGVAFFAGAI